MLPIGKANRISNQDSISVFSGVNDERDIARMEMQLSRIIRIRRAQRTWPIPAVEVIDNSGQHPIAGLSAQAFTKILFNFADAPLKENMR